MANINYAEKYSSVIDERFKLVSLTSSAVNNNYDFNGVNKINVYSTDTVPLNDYDLSATSSRYGTPEELGNDIQEMILTQDKSFTFTIDRRNLDDTMMANQAGAALQRQIDEVVTPTVDKYRLSVMVTNAGTELEQTITSENAYESFLDAGVELIEKKVPVSGRIAFVTPAYYKLIKLDRHFISYGDKANEIANSGVVGYIDNTALIVAPSEYLQ